jgi:hypothetical protein
MNLSAYQHATTREAGATMGAAVVQTPPQFVNRLDQLTTTLAASIPMTALLIHDRHMT